MIIYVMVMLETEKIFFTDLNLPGIETLVRELGEKDFRAKQLSRWVYQALVSDFEEMTDLPRSFRNSLSSRLLLHCLNPVHHEIGHDGTVKVLFSLRDNQTIESVLMPHTTNKKNKHATLCISTQVGCPIGCPFCATGQQGLIRNLSQGEIVDQVLFLARWARENHKDVRVTNIVFMGMGEPLLNYENLIKAIQILNSPDCFGLGARNMTISTSGIIPGIKNLMDSKIQVNLAISLHAGNNRLRNKLVPINKKYPLEELIFTCHQYVLKTSRRITFEYILFEGINDTMKHADEVAGLLNNLLCHVNLIPANNTGSSIYLPPRKDVLISFAERLKSYHIPCTIRKSRGTDINAGCGQLRRKLLNN